MTRTIYCLTFLSLALGSEAQEIYKDAKDMEKTRLAETTTYVELLGDTAYDQAMRDAFSDGWSITKAIEFIQPGDSMWSPADPTRSYLSHWWYTNSTGQKQLVLVLWQGHATWEHATYTPKGITDVAFIKSFVIWWPLDQFGKEYKPELASWRLPLIIRSMEQMVRYMKETKASVAGLGGALFTYRLPLLRAEKMTPALTGRLKDKVLMLWDKRFKVDEVASLRKEYPGRTQVVDLPMIREAIARRDSSYAILTLSTCGAGRHDLIVHDAGTHEMLYAKFSDGRYPPRKEGLIPADVKALSRAVLND